MALSSYFESAQLLEAHLKFLARSASVSGTVLAV